MSSLPALRSAPLTRPVPKLPGGGSGVNALRQALPKPVREIVADRTATTSTWQNANHTITVRRYLVPHFYKSGSGRWLPINPVLAATAGRPGWWHSVADSWQVSFGPVGAAGGAEQVRAGGGQVGFAPLGVSDPALAPLVAGATATYAGLWPAVDLSERLSASQVNEGIVLTSRRAGSSFGFRVLGATPRPNAAGGADVLAGGRRVGVIPPLTVTTASIAPRFGLRSDLPDGAVTDVTRASGARLTVEGGVVRISVSPNWLAGLPAWAFPVVIDPTYGPVNETQNHVVSVSSNGVLQGVMQNGLDSHGQVWRSAAYIPAPATPAPEPGNWSAWQLTLSTFSANCYTAPSPCGGSAGLTGLGVFGLATPQSSIPSFSAIPNGSPIWVNPPNSGWAFISTPMTAFMRGQQPGGGWVGVVSNEVGLGYGTLVTFDPSTVYGSFEYVEQPPPTTITAPAYGSVLPTLTPTLTAAPAANETSAYYDFKISTAYDGTGTVIDSGWLSNQTSWTVPPGSLQDGVKYYATVLDAISQQWDPSDPGYVPPAAPNSPTYFQIKERLGAGGPSPTDTVGSPPGSTSKPSQGAPSPGVTPASETVDMVTGNLSVSVGTPSMQALSGGAGITLTYNSSASSLSTGSGNYGLTSQYYADDGSHTFPSDPSTNLAGQRTDPEVDSTWGYAPPIGGLNQGEPFIARWTGWLSLPQGTWKLGGLTTGGMRVYLSGSTTPSYDDWAGTATLARPSYGTATVSGPQRIQIEVDDWDSSLTGQTTVQLWAKNTAITDPKTPSAFVVPSSWLTPVATGVPLGWSLLANAAMVRWTRAVDTGSQVVLQGSAGETATFTRLTQLSGGQYLAPAGDGDLLSVDRNGHLQLATSTNYLYTFNADGSLKSMTTVADDRHPAALQYTYGPASATPGAPVVLTSISDPVSNRSITLYYDNAAQCTAPNTVELLCGISYWDGTSSSFVYNSGNELSEVVNPGTSQTPNISLFAYDSGNRLADIRDALASDYVAAGGSVGPAVPCGAGTTGLSVTPVDTQICYDSSGRVATVTQPAPAPGAARPGRTYTYASGHTDVSIAGFSPASGYAERTAYDSQDRVIQQTDSAGHTTTAVWANATGPNPTWSVTTDELIVTASPAGQQTSIVYDANGHVTDTYGPAPVACFSGGWPGGVTPTAPVQGYLPVASPQTTSGCGIPAVPHTQHGYDEGITGLAATFWSNGQFAGPAALHATGDGGPQPASFCGSGGLCAQWAAGSPPVSPDASGHWSLRLTGTISIPPNSGYYFGVYDSQPVIVSIDGSQILNDSPATVSNYVPGQQNSLVTDGAVGVAAGIHRIEVDFQGSATQLNDFTISYAPDTGATITWQVIPNTVLDPNYGLQTSTTDPDGVTTTTSYSNAAIGPEYGLATSTTVGAGSSTPLTTTTAYEAPGAGSFLRKTATTLPAGNQTTYAYYPGTGGAIITAPTCGVNPSTPQGGQLEQQTDPAPGSDPSQARVQQFLYDTAGRQAGQRIGTKADIATQPWQCISYDALGRVSSQTWPAANGAPARTVTHNYSVGGNPLVSSVADASGTVTSTVDLLGRPTSYTDAWNKTTTISYNQAGQTISTTYDPSGKNTQTQLGYDPNTGQPTTTTVNGTLLATASYDTATGRLTGVSYGNTTTASIGYDADGHQNLIRYANTATGTFAAEGVTYSPAGRVSTETDRQPSGSLATVSYCYDGAGRLASVNGSSGCTSPATSSYSYASNPASDNCPADGGNPGQGANTNRTSVTTPAGTTDYCYNTADQLVAAITAGTTTTSYTYNEHGDQTTDNATTYTWDASDRVATATTGGTTITSTYDPVDRLIQSSQSGGSTVRYSYAGYTDAPAAVLDTSGNVLQLLIALPGGVTVTLQPPTAGNTWSYANLQGDTTATASDTGTRTAGPVTYDPWGNLNPGQTPPASTTGPNTLGAYASSGKFTTTATGTILLGARTFNPSEARFLSVDPVNGGCANPYTYAYGDPLNHPDLSGRNSCTDWADFSLLDLIQAVVFFIIGEGVGALLEEAGHALLAALVSSAATAVDVALDVIKSQGGPPGLTAPGSGRGTPLGEENFEELLAKLYIAGALKVNTKPDSYYEIGYHQWLYDCWSAGIWMYSWGPPPKAP